MKERQHCAPKDMILFLLALCCQDDSATPVSRNASLDRCFEECLREVTPVASSTTLQEKLNK